MCDQQSLRPACAYAQSDQSLCLSLGYSMTVKLLTEHHLEVLSLKGDCTGSPESTLIKVRDCWEITCRGSIVIITNTLNWVCNLSSQQTQFCPRKSSLRKRASAYDQEMRQPKTTDQLHGEELTQNSNSYTTGRTHMK